VRRCHALLFLGEANAALRSLAQEHLAFSVFLSVEPRFALDEEAQKLCSEPAGAKRDLSGGLLRFNLGEM
jgi:hypothetical protein